MPAAEDDREVFVPRLNVARDLHRLPNHRAGHEGDSKTQSVLDLVQDTLLEIWGDRGIDDADLIAGAKQWRCNRQQAERSGCFAARNSRKEKYYLRRSFRASEAYNRVAERITQSVWT